MQQINDQNQTKIDKEVETTTNPLKQDSAKEYFKKFSSLPEVPKVYQGDNHYEED